MDSKCDCTLEGPSCNKAQSTLSLIENVPVL